MIYLMFNFLFWKMTVIQTGSKFQIIRNRKFFK